MTIKASDKMRGWNVWRLQLLLILLLTLPAVTAFASSPLAHPNHVSLAEIAFNGKTKRYEVSLCVWPEDLKTIVEKLNGQERDPLNEKSLAKYCPKYLQENFFLIDGKESDQPTSSIRWVGAEVKVKKAWLYFELIPNTSDVNGEDSVGIAAKPTASGPMQQLLKNRMFMELNEDQVNHVKFTTSKDVAWFSLNKSADSCTISKLVSNDDQPDVAATR